MTAAVVFRRSAARPPVPMRRRWVRLVVPVVVLAGSLGVGALLIADRGEHGAGAGGVEVEGTPVAYSVRYETTYAGSPTVEERLEVERPFRSRFGDGDSERITDLGVLATRSGGAGWVTIAVPVAPAGGDLRPLAVLDAAVAEGLVIRDGADEVAGRACERFRLGGPVTGGNFTPVGATDGEHAEVCIDGQGLVLSEEWFADGDLIRRRTAVHVHVGPTEDGRFRIPEDAFPLDFEDGGGALREVDAAADPGFARHWRLGEVPEGFTFLGRWAVVPPALSTELPATDRRRTEVALVTDVWTRGPDLLLLDQGATLDGVAPPWDESAATTAVDLEALGDGSLAWDLRMSEVRVVGPDGAFLRVASTLPPDELVSLSRTLHPDSAGGAP